jgi:hypothetical protein
MNAAGVLRAIRAHERQCQWSCPACQAKLARRLDAVTRQLRAEEDIRQWLRDNP